MFGRLKTSTIVSDSKIFLRLVVITFNAVSTSIITNFFNYSILFLAVLEKNNQLRLLIRKLNCPLLPIVIISLAATFLVYVICKKLIKSLYLIFTITLLLIGFNLVQLNTLIIFLNGISKPLKMGCDQLIVYVIVLMDKLLNWN